MKLKKAQGLSLNVIIVAAIVLIVLIVLWAIFTGKMGGVSKELANCRGTCRLRGNCNYATTGVEDPQAKAACPDDNEIRQENDISSMKLIGKPPEEKVCCVPLG